MGAQPDIPSAGQSPPDSYRIFEELYPVLRRFAAVTADLDVDPDDLVQEALVATLARHDLTEIQRPAAYLKQAILNLATSHRRRAGRLRGLLPRLLGETASVDAYPSDLALLDTLDPIDRAVLYLGDVEGLPHTLIADELSLTAPAVRKRASRARRQLRQTLRPEIVALPGDTER